MSSAIQIAKETGNDNFYPTPDYLIDKMLDGVDWTMIGKVLEPSAGKGNIIKKIVEKSASRVYGCKVSIDAIEKDDYIRSILKYEMSEEKKYKLLEEYRPYNELGWQGKQELSAEKRLKYEFIGKEIDLQDSLVKHVQVVHDDFLTYSTVNRYDLIVMNPPFDNGDKHILKAIEMQKNGGSIICLLNAETIRNPYSNTRKELIKKLDELNASVEFVDSAFMDAERKTDVSVAIVKIYIEKKERESEIYNRMQEACEYEEMDFESTEIEVTDYLKMIVNRYNVEVRSGLELMRMADELKHHVMSSFSSDYAKQLLSFDISQNDYVKKTRHKYWTELLYNDKVTGRLTSKLKEEFRDRVERLSRYEFSEFNINQLVAEINANIHGGIKDEIFNLFDELTVEHSWYPETKNNIHYYNGWKTNSAHKIGKKVIIPTSVFRYNYFSSANEYDLHKAYSVLSDIELTLDYLAGNTGVEVNLFETLKSYQDQGITRNIPLKYFKATFYKKGTIHLTFTNEELIDRFNIYVAKERNWLPPYYGKAAYSDMSEEEKAVIDDFQGEAAYKRVMERANYFLAPVAGNNTLMLEG